MKVLILTNHDMGLYKLRKELIEELCKKHKVAIALPDGEYISRLEKLGCEYFPIKFDRRGTNISSDLKQINQYIELIKKLKPHVVLTYTIKPNIYGGIACRFTRTPYISNITGLGTAIENGGLLKFLTMALYKVGLRRANCVFFQNKQNQELFIAKKIVKLNTRLIPGSGVNLSNHCCEDYPSVKEGVRFLYIGRIMKDKGIEELLLASRAVKQLYPEYHLDIIGSYDEDYRAALEIAEKESIIHYHGQQSSVHFYIANTHCSILPSYHEGIANVMLESASTGRPIITTRVPGCIETFVEGVTGLGCEVRNVNSLIKAMVKFIELPYQEKKQMGLNGRLKMEREFDRRIVISAYLEEINKIDATQNNS